jgi:hypothetical protein
MQLSRVLHTILKILNKYRGAVRYSMQGGAGIFVFVVFFGILNTVVQYIPLSMVTGLKFTGIMHTVCPS